MRFETMLVLDVRRVLDYTGCAKKKIRSPKIVHNFIIHKDFPTNLSGFVKEPILHIYVKCHDKRFNHFKDIRVLLKEAKIKIAQRSKITTLHENASANLSCYSSAAAASLAAAGLAVASLGRKL